MSSISSVISYIEEIQRITSDVAGIARHHRTNPASLGLYADVIAKGREEKLSRILQENAQNPDYLERKRQPFKYFYRGHYQQGFTPCPSVLWQKNWEKEDYYYHEIMVQCPERFQFLPRLDRLVLMQHYDCPTRLLDITSNPLVALYFACKNFHCKNCDASPWGEVFVFPVLPEEVAYADSDKALMLSCMPRFSTNDKQELTELCYNSLSVGKFQKIGNGSRYSDKVVERFFHEITTSLPSFKREIKPIDLLQPLFIQPNKSNSRILKQDGAFILSVLSRNAEEAADKIESISYNTITIEHQEDILKELEQLGIHEAALFPEVDKVANYLKERG